MRERLPSGIQVIGMEPRETGSNDLISHTLRHFVRDGGCFDQLPPLEALPSRAARWRLIEARVSERELDALPIRYHDRIDPVWWSPQRQRMLIAIHDEGYWPRYLHVLRTASTPDARGSRWVLSDSSGHWQYTDARRTSIWAKWRPRERALEVTSAYRWVLPDDRPAIRRESPEDEFLRKLLKK